MSPSADSQSPKTPDDPRKIGKLAHTYAQNRSLGMVVMMLISFVLFLAISIPSYYGGMAYRAGQWPLCWSCIAVLSIAMAATLYISVPRWGGKLAEGITKRLYAGEGKTQLAPPRTRGRSWMGALLAVTFGGCILTSVVLGVMGFLPIRYMQPISAIYTVPFLVGLWLLMRPAAGPVFLLWPGLYALHAVLIVMGAPIRFTGRWDSLNMFLPVFGYGLLTGLISHIYSRFVLQRLRRVAGGSESEAVVEAPRP